MISKDLKDIAKNIKLLILDVDGVLTNGDLLYLDEYFLTGEYKSFNARDGLGLSLLIKSGVELAIISGNKSFSVKRRFKKFKTKHLYQGVSDKKKTYDKIKKKLMIDDVEVAYMGDDLIDLPVMTKVGLPTAVFDADEFVKSKALWVSSKKGGHGAVRELCEFILESQNKLDTIRNSFL